jgi:hypothetical protein
MCIYTVWTSLANTGDTNWKQDNWMIILLTWKTGMNSKHLPNWEVNSLNTKWLGFSKIHSQSLHDMWFTVLYITITAFWNMTPSSLVDRGTNVLTLQVNFYHEDWGSQFLQNICTSLPHYTCHSLEYCNFKPQFPFLEAALILPSKYKVAQTRNTA